jgi:hypothetical protein
MWSSGLSLLNDAANKEANHASIGAGTGGRAKFFGKKNRLASLPPQSPNEVR